MKQTMIAAALVCLTSLAGAQDQSYADCVKKEKSTWGQPCAKCESYTEVFKRDYSGVFQIELKNVCKEVVEVKVAMQEENGRWRTFPMKALGPEESMTAFACKGTGKYLYWVRRLNDSEILLPSDRQIIAEYNEK